MTSGDPSRFGARTTADRLIETGLLDKFYAAAVARDRRALLDIFGQIEIGGVLGETTADTVLAKPPAYYRELIRGYHPGVQNYVEPEIVPGKEYLEALRLPKGFKFPRT